jgi:acyl dehydratase
MWAASPAARAGPNDSGGEISSGWIVFREFRVGQVFRHAIRRTLTGSGQRVLQRLTHNPAALHLDEEYCRKHTEFGTRVVNSAFTLGLMVGISVGDTTLGTAVANLGWDEVRFPRPLFHGDTLRVETEVLGCARRPSNRASAQPGW